MKVLGGLGVFLFWLGRGWGEGLAEEEEEEEEEERGGGGEEEMGNWEWG